MAKKKTKKKTFDSSGSTRPKASAPGRATHVSQPITTYPQATPTAPVTTRPPTSRTTGGVQAPSTPPRRTTPRPAVPTNTPVDPMAPLTGAQMLAAAKASAMAGIQPQLDAANRDQTMGQSAHDTRVQQISDWSNWQGGRLDAAFKNATDAANNLITLQGGVDQKSRDALAAALRGATAGTGDAAALIGGTMPAENTAGVLEGAAAADKSMEMGIGAGMGASLGALGESRGLAGIGLQQNQEVERQRWNAQLGDITSKRNDLNAQIPGLITASLKDQKDFGLAQAQLGEQKAARMFQQYLSEKEFNLKAKDQTFQQWLATQTLGETVRSNKAGEKNTRTANANTAAQNIAQNAIDWANVGINKQNATNQYLAIVKQANDAKDKKTQDAAKARAAGLQSGYDALAAYLTPGKDEAQHSATNRYPTAPGSPAVVGGLDQTGQGTDKTAPNYNPNYGKTVPSSPAVAPYKRTFADALRTVQSRTTSYSDALRILMNSPYTDWQKRARYLLNRMKGRGSPQPSRPPVAPGPSGQNRPT